jgi:diguanylate cyclase (GGDEF)-like protein
MMTEHFGDARLEELKLLSEIERRGELPVTPVKGPLRDLVAYLVKARYVNDLHVDWAATQAKQFSGLPNESDMERALNGAHLESLSRALSGSQFVLKLTHQGRLRMAELRDALRSGHIREQYGILWDGRHLERDLQVALVDVRADAPLSVAFLDMNGLKAISDTASHDAGSMVVRAYFHAVSTVLGDKGAAYAIGGDEVFVLLPAQDTDQAMSILGAACLLLMREQLIFDSRALPRVSVAVGIASVTDHATTSETLRRQADQSMYRAKEEAHKTHPMPSAIAVYGDVDVHVVC